MQVHKKQTAAIAEATKCLEELELMDTDNWWNHMRLSFVKYVLSKFNLPTSHKKSLLDFGCGKGIQLAKLKASHSSIDYAGYEPYFSSEMVDTSIPLFRDIHALTSKRFDFVTALDVIEHIEDDVEALQQIHRLMTVDGTLIINVPAYMHLWCPLDTAGGHYRRYTKHSLQVTIEKAGFRVVEIFYVFPYGWPAYLLRRYIYKTLDLLGIDYSPNKVMNHLPIDPLRIFSTLVAAELALIKKTKFRSPFGSSLFLSATKQS